MTAPHQRFLIIGFCDSQSKQHGTWQCTHFAERDQFETDHLPTKEALIDHAKRVGMWPSNKRGSSLEICAPIYHSIGEGLDYLNCAQCYPRGEVIDNRAGPG